MAATDITLTNSTNSKQFKFRGVSNLKKKRIQPAITIPLINVSAENALLFRFIGQTEDITWTFALFDDGVDVSNGDAITTIAQQIAYLRDNIFTENFDTTWTITDDLGVYAADTCVVTSLDMGRVGGRPNLSTGTISVRLGTIGAL